MVEPAIELQGDGSIVVRGLSLDEVRAKLIVRPPGRPSGPEITRAEILAAIDSRRQFDVPTQDDLAADLAVSRHRLREAVGRNFGSWRQLVAITASREAGDSGS